MSAEQKSGVYSYKSNYISLLLLNTLTTLSFSVFSLIFLLENRFNSQKVIFNMAKSVTLDRKARNYICLGTTGTGKSIFVRAMGCEIDVKDIQDNEHSNTQAVTFYPIPLNHEMDPTFLIDTPGLRDTKLEERPDLDLIHKQQLIEAFQKSDASHFHGIFWFCKDNKRTPELLEQARLIDDLVQPYRHQPGESAPRAEIDREQRAQGWKHVAIMLYTGIRPLAVRQAIQEVTGGDIIGEQVRCYRVGLKLGNSNTGDCDVRIDAELDPHSGEEKILDCTLQHPTKADVLTTFFSSTEPIQVRVSRHADRELHSIH